MLCVDAFRDGVEENTSFSLHLSPSLSLGWYLGSELPSGRRTEEGCREAQSILGGTGTGRRAQSGGSGNCADRASEHISLAEPERWEGA